MMEGNRLIRRLQMAGLRPTPTRIKVLEILAEIPGTLRMEEVYRRLIERGVEIHVGAVYRALRKMREAGLLLNFQDANRVMRYGFPSEAAQSPVFHIASHDGNATFTDLNLHAQLLAAIANAGLELDGQEFTLSVRLAPRKPEWTRNAARHRRSGG